MKNQALTLRPAYFALITLLAISVVSASEAKRNSEDSVEGLHKRVRTTNPGPSFQDLFFPKLVALPEPKPVLQAPYTFKLSDFTTGCEITFLLNAHPKETQTYSFKQLLSAPEIEQAHTALHKHYNNLSVLPYWFPKVWGDYRFSNLAEFLDLAELVTSPALHNTHQNQKVEAVCLHPLPFYHSMSSLLSDFLTDVTKAHSAPMQMSTSFFAFCEETLPPPNKDYAQAPINLSFANQKVLLLPSLSAMKQQPNKTITFMSLQNIDVLFPYPFQLCTTLRALKFKDVGHFPMLSSSVPTSLTSLDIERSRIPPKAFLQNALSLRHYRLNSCERTDTQLFIPSSITHLELSNLRLHVMPNLTTFTCLQKLSLQGNFITDASDDILPTSLTELDITRNRLVSLSLQRLTNLTRLHITPGLPAAKQLYLPSQKLEIIELEEQNQNSAAPLLPWGAAPQ